VSFVSFVTSRSCGYKINALAFRAGRNDGGDYFSLCRTWLSTSRGNRRDRIHGLCFCHPYDEGWLVVPARRACIRRSHFVFRNDIASAAEPLGHVDILAAGYRNEPIRRRSFAADQDDIERQGFCAFAIVGTTARTAIKEICTRNAFRILPSYRRGGKRIVLT